MPEVETHPSEPEAPRRAKGERVNAAFRSRRLAPAALAVVDQGVVSGTSFLAAVLVGRICGSVELAAYALVFTLAVLAQVVQDSLVLAGYTVEHPLLAADPARQRRFAGSVRVQQAGLSVLVALALLTAGLVLWRFDATDRLGPTLTAAGCAAPLLLLREFLRRELINQGNTRRSLALNVGVAVGWLSLLAVAAGMGWLTAPAAFLCWGAACGAAVAVELLSSREKIEVCRRELAADVRHNLRFGAWLAVSQVVGVVHGYLMHWMLKFWHGDEATGLFAACATLVYLTNPLVIGVGNMSAPLLAREMAAGGLRQVAAATRRVTLGLAACMLLVTGTLSILGGWLTVALFGQEYAGLGWTVAVLSAGLCIGSLCVPLEAALRAVRKPVGSLVSSIAGLSISAIAAVLLIGPYAVLGAAAALSAGRAATTLVRWKVLSQAFEEDEPSAAMAAEPAHA